MTDTSTDVIDNSSDNGQSDDTITGLDPEDNQQTLQQESVTKLATVVSITMQEDFLQDLCDNASISTHFPDETFVMAQGIVGTTITVLCISQRLIHFHPPYGIVFHSCLHQLIQRIVQHVFNTFVYGYQNPYNFMQSFFMEYRQLRDSLIYYLLLIILIMVTF